MLDNRTLKTIKSDRLNAETPLSAFCPPYPQSIANWKSWKDSARKKVEAKIKSNEDKSPLN